MQFGIIVSEWNAGITDELYNGAYETLIKYGVSKSSITKRFVPGSFELPMGAQYIAENYNTDAIICIGCVIQGETRHFEFISNAVANGIMDVGLKYDLPVIFCVLTPDNIEQAKARSGGEHGNKGVEAAISAIKMVALRRN